jgi:hypothetical protein
VERLERLLNDFAFTSARQLIAGQSALLT